MFIFNNVDVFKNPPYAETSTCIKPVASLLSPLPSSSGIRSLSLRWSINSNVRALWFRTVISPESD